MRLLLLCLVFCYCFIPSARAQDIIFSAPVSDARFNQFEIIGKVGTDFLVTVADLKTKQRSILVYDTKMQLKKEYDLNLLPEKAFNLNYIAYQNGITIIYRYLKNDTSFCEAVRLDSNLNQLSGPVLLDFTTASYVPVRLEYSQDKSKILLCKFNYRDSAVILSTKLFDAQLQLQHTTSSPLAFDPVNEQIQYFRIANDGTVYFLILPAANRVYNRLNDFEVVYNNFKTPAYNSLLVQLNNKYINANLKVELNNLTSRLLVSAAYYGLNNTDSVSGLFTASVDAGANSATSFLNPFDENIIAQLNKKYASMTKGKNFEVKDIIPQSNGGFVITSEITLQNRFSSAGSYTGAAFPPVVMKDRDYGASKMGGYNIDAPYYIDYYLGGGFPNSINTSTPGNNDAGNLVYDDMIVTYFNDSMKLSASFVVAKKQAYKYLSPAKLSYLTLNNGREISLLFNTGNISKNIIYHKSFTAAGQSALRPALRTTNDRNILIPLFSKQVSLNQAMLAFSYHNNIRFGLFNF